MNKDKIVIARIWPRYEGYVSSRASIIFGMDNQKYDKKIIFLMKNSDKPCLFEQKGIDTFYLSTNRRFRVFNLKIIWKLIKIFKSQKIDILQCHGHLAVVYGTIAAKLAKVPVVLSHVPGLNRSKRTRRKVVNKIIFKWIDKILTTGNAVREDVIESNWNLPPEKVFSIGNSIDTENFENVTSDKQKTRQNIGVDQNSFVFGTVGRLAPTKNLPCLINAFAKAKQTLNSATLLIVGQGRLEEKLKELAREKNCLDSIRFLGQRDDIPELLRAMDTFVMTSVAEGMPRSMLEAMVSEVPCIATNVGGVPEILNDGEYGSIVPSDDAEALAKAMINATKMTPQNTLQLTQKAKAHVLNNYKHQKMIQTLDKLYYEQLKKAWSYPKYLKYGIELKISDDKNLPIKQLAVQYNPDRFDQYKLFHKGPPQAVLDMEYSPHCRLVRAYQKDRKKIFSKIITFDYYKMQRRFGKNHKSAMSKVERLLSLFDSIKKDGFNTKIIVVKKPIVANEFNRGYEIYTGHHRVACCIVLGIDTIPCEIADVIEKYTN